MKRGFAAILGALLVAGIIRYQSDDKSEATAEYCFYAMNPRGLVACSGHNT